jgi:hypothetical protein
MLRLIEDAVVARRTLEAVHPTNWPAFVLLGRTKSGKTLIGRLAARRFGLEPTEAIRLLMRETPGSLLGRRVQKSADTWTSVPSSLLSLPLIVLDEFDKAAPELQLAAFAYLDGASRYQSEGLDVAVHATAIVTLNTERDPGRLLPDAYLRRAVVLDMTPLRAVTRDLDVVAAALARVVLPQVSPDLAPPEPMLPDAAWGGLRRLLRDCLTERGWELIDVEALSRLVLGRWATLPADLEAAVLSVAADYLLLTTTREGLVLADWAVRFETTVGRAVAPIGAARAAAHSRQIAHEESQAATDRAARVTMTVLAGERERLHDALDHAVSSAPRGGDLTSSERATIATARGKAHVVRGLISGARSPAALGELDRQLEGDVLAPLRTVGGAVEARRGADARMRVQQRQREADDRQHVRERDKAASQAASAARGAAKARHAELESLYRRSVPHPGEAVLDALLDAGCLTRQSEQYEAETLGSQLARSRLGRGLGALRGPVASSPPPAPPAASPWPVGMAPWSPSTTLARPAASLSSGAELRYVTKTRTWYEDHSGRRYAAGDVVAWSSDAVRAVLEAVAAAEGLPPLTRPVQRRASPRRV